MFTRESLERRLNELAGEEKTLAVEMDGLKAAYAQNESRLKGIGAEKTVIATLLGVLRSEEEQAYECVREHDESETPEET